MPIIYHITSAAETEEAGRVGEYVPKGFETDGFTHCSYARQVTGVANIVYRGQTDLVLLEIDRSKVGTEVVDENLDGGPELFPHVYGPLPMAAVVRVHQFPCREDGTFDLPRDVSV